jgi:hypothetical protein
MNLIKQKSPAFCRGRLFGRAKQERSSTNGGGAAQIPLARFAAVAIDPDEEVRKAVAGCIQEQTTLRVTEQAKIIAEHCSVPAVQVAEDLISAGLGARVSMEVGPSDEMKRSDAAIRSRAYAIWERNGCTGSADDHWYAAQRELSAEAK